MNKIKDNIKVILLFTFGFKFTYNPKLDTSWDAISAVGQWVGAIAALLIPLAVIYIDKSIDMNRAAIGESNAALLEELESFKHEYHDKLARLSKLVNADGDIVIDGGTFGDENDTDSVIKAGIEELKEKALKFVNITMVTNTKRVASQ